MKRKLWGGRFRGRTNPLVEKFTHSLNIDRRLARYDLAGSIAHARMLGKTDIIPRTDSHRLVRGLKGLLKLELKGRLQLHPAAEDIHTAIQQLLEKKLGETAQHLHTARSRNDQVVTSLRLYLKNHLKILSEELRALQRGILNQAQGAGNLVMPGYTHLRHAQPVLVAHVLVSYLPALERDRERLQEARDRLDELPLGSGALTGTGLPINRKAVARELGFARVVENSIDGVTDRDFVVEILSAFSLISTHCARIAEDLLLWSTAEFGFLRFHEKLLTGSSMMPQKQNPDFLELIRAGQARVLGNLTGMLGLLKGLPSGYQRDLQLDKEFLFEAFDRTQVMVQVLRQGFQGIQWNKKKLLAQLMDESLYATDLAEYLVAKGVPFAQAHRASGKLFSYLDRQEVSIRAVSLDSLRRFHPALDQGVYKLFNPASSVSRKRSAGSTHPAKVALSVRQWKRRLR